MNRTYVTLLGAAGYGTSLLEAFVPQMTCFRLPMRRLGRCLRLATKTSSLSAVHWVDLKEVR